MQPISALKRAANRRQARMPVPRGKGIPACVSVVPHLGCPAVPIR